jgi:hypothetical protein
MNSDTKDFKIMLEINTARKFNPYLKSIRIIGILLLSIIIIWVVIFRINRKKKI